MNQRKMFRVPPNHKVVRRLDFGGDKDDQAKTDNFANKMKELIETDRQVMTKKYNFDMKNEVPLEGDWTWMKKSENEWVGVKGVKDKENVVVKENDNDKTPIASRDGERVPPTKRLKRLRDDKGTCRDQVKKRLTME